jgi:site-specific DNA recombinase
MTRARAVAFLPQDENVEEYAPKRVAIWIRVSTEDQAKGESPEHHEHRARAYAESKGWQVVTVYHLEGVSGKAVMGHPEARRMMDDVKAKRITGLIFSKLARLARNTKELLEFAEFFKTEGADLISLQESIDTSTPAGRFFYTMIAAMAAWEREEIAERVAASIPIRAKLGKPLGGPPPFGYVWKEKKLVPHPEEAPIRRLIYELFLEHRRFQTVARVLNDRGYRTRGGGRFTQSTVGRLLTDPIAKGERRANFTRSRGDGKGWELKPQDQWVTSAVEPVVSEEVWQEANDFISARRSRRERAPRQAVQLFGGLTFCHCGQKMYVKSNTPKYVCTRKGCGNKAPQAELDRVFQIELARFADSADAVEACLADAEGHVREKVDLLDALAREEERLRAEGEKLYRLYLADELTPRGFGERHRPIEERLLALEEEIPRLQGEIDFLKIQHLSREEVAHEAAALAAAWDDLSQEERRAIVQTIVTRVTVTKDEIEITLAYLPRTPSPPPPPLEMVATHDHNLPLIRRV